MHGDFRGGAAVRDANSRLHTEREEHSRELDRKEEDSQNGVILGVDNREEGSQEVVGREVELAPDLHCGASFRTDVPEGKLASFSTMTRVFSRDPRVKHNSRTK